MRRCISIIVSSEKKWVFVDAVHGCDWMQTDLSNFEGKIFKDRSRFMKTANFFSFVIYGSNCTVS